MLTRAPVTIAGGGGVNLLANNWLQCHSNVGDFSCPSTGSEHDLAAMVSDFIEFGSAGAESWCSSDGDSGFSDLAYLSDRISFYKHSAEQYEVELKMVVKSLLLSMTETNQPGNPNTCNSNCVLRSLVRLLQFSGYDAALSISKWQGSAKVPGGEHEFIDVVIHGSNEELERYIIDIDFRSHFQIARAVPPYNIVLNSLPPIYVGTVTKLKHLLQIMVEAAKYSLDQNSMPLPPWRSLPYLEAKWESSCQRKVTLDIEATSSSSHQHCIGLLQRLKSFVESDFKS